MRLRQVVLVAADLEMVVHQLCDIFEIDVAYRDPGVELFGLHNAVMPIGDTFLEVVSPIRDDAAAARYRQRRGGDCGYMVMVQSDDYRRDRARIETLGVRIVWSAELEDICGMHLHPRDTGGPLLSLDQPVPPESWRWAGPDWPTRSNTGNERTVVAAEIADPDPAARARRWAEVLARTARPRGTDWEIALDRGTLRFVTSEGPKDIGLRQIDLHVADAEATRRRAGRHDSLVGSAIRLGGTTFNIAP